MEKDEKMSHKSRVMLELILAVAFVAIFCYILQEHAPKILKILESGNVKEIDDYLEQYGTDGKLLLILLQVIETLSIVIPSIPVYICAGILFGKVWGIIVCYAVNLILTLIIFAFSRRMKDFTKKHFDITKQKMVGALLNNTKHMDRVVACMCVLPIIPGGMIPLLSSQTDISFPDFAKAVAVGSLPAIAVYVCAGDFLMTENYKVTAGVIVVLALAALLIFIFRKKLSKWLEDKMKSIAED